MTDAGEPKPPVTASEVKALPMRMRQYVHMLETDCDPSGTIRELAYAKEQIAQLTAKIASLISQEQA